MIKDAIPNSQCDAKEVEKISGVIQAKTSICTDLQLRGGDLVKLLKFEELADAGYEG